MNAPAIPLRWNIETLEILSVLDHETSIKKWTVHAKSYIISESENAIVFLSDPKMKGVGRKTGSSGLLKEARTDELFQNGPISWASGLRYFFNKCTQVFFCSYGLFIYFILEQMPESKLLQSTRCPTTCWTGRFNPGPWTVHACFF